MKVVNPAISQRISIGAATIYCLSILLGACQNESTVPPPDLLTAAQLGKQSTVPVAEILRRPEYAGADLDRGARLAMQCRACHTLAPDGPQLLGPNLHRIFNRPAGQIDGFPYSAAIRESSFIWTPKAMDAFLTQPFIFLPGSQMAFVGMPRSSDRNDLIAFLLHETESP